MPAYQTGSCRSAGLRECLADPSRQVLKPLTPHLQRVRDLRKTLRRRVPRARRSRPPAKRGRVPRPWQLGCGALPRRAFSSAMIQAMPSRTAPSIKEKMSPRIPMSCHMGEEEGECRKYVLEENEPRACCAGRSSPVLPYYLWLLLRPFRQRYCAFRARQSQAVLRHKPCPSRRDWHFSLPAHAE